MNTLPEHCTIEDGGDTLAVRFDRYDSDSYPLFLACKKLPETRITADPETLCHTLRTPARFAKALGFDVSTPDPVVLPLCEKLYDDQRWIVRRALEVKRYACWSDCGGGKGLPPDAPVLTPCGYRPIGELQVGDEVIGGDGKSCRVEGVFRRGVQPLYRVSFNDGSSVVCDEDHLWKVRSGNDKARGKPWRVLSVRELLASSLRFGHDERSRTWEIPLVGAVEMERVEHLIHPYVLGVLLGDGNLTHGRVSWSKPDDEIGVAVAGLLPESVRLRRHQSGDKCPVWAIIGVTHGRNPVLDELDRLGLTGLGSPMKFVPLEYLGDCAEHRLALLQGLMDTDGHVDATHCEFCSTSKPLADAVVWLTQSLGGIATIACKEEPRYTGSDGETRSGLPAWRVRVSLPPHLSPFRLKRKAERYSPATRNFCRRIDSIEPVGEGESVCIKVSSPDSTFVTNDCIVTHNTLIGLEWSRQVSARTGGGRVLIVTLAEIVPQWVEEARKFYGDTLPVKVLRTGEEMRQWMRHGDGTHTLAVTNYEKWNNRDEQLVPEAKFLAGIVLDESSRLKTGGGVQKWSLIKSVKGMEYKLSLTATPAPNKPLEFASQASFLEKIRDDGEIIWTYFARDSNQEWTVKPNAREGFYRFMSAWSIYLRDPRVYGWRQGIAIPPAPEVIVHEIEPTKAQAVERHRLAGTDERTGQQSLFTDENEKKWGVVQRNRLSQIAKGFEYLAEQEERTLKDGTVKVKVIEGRYRRIRSRKPAFVADLVRDDLAQGRKVLVWTVFDAEAELLSEQLRKRGIDHVTLDGSVPKAKRAKLLDAFRHEGDEGCKVLISKPKLLGYGMNLQCATSMIFSGYDDSYEAFYQAMRRSWRHGQTESVRIRVVVVKGLESMIWENLQAKARHHERSIAEMERGWVLHGRDAA